MSKSASITLILLCIAVLLTSACGWGPPDVPYITSHDFVLWQPVAGGLPRAIGYGSINGGSTRVQAVITLFDTGCLARSPISLSDTLSLQDAKPSFNLTSAAVVGGTATLSGDLRQTSKRVFSPVFPLRFAFTPADGCAQSAVIQAEALPGPDLHHGYYGTTDEPKGSQRFANLTLSQTRPDANGNSKLWGVVFNGYDPDCSIKKIDFSVDLTSSTPRSPRTVTFTGRNDPVRMTVENIPYSLDPTPVLPLHLAFHIAGGPCDGKSFTATLAGH